MSRPSARPLSITPKVVQEINDIKVKLVAIQKAAGRFSAGTVDLNGKDISKTYILHDDLLAKAIGPDVSGNLLSAIKDIVGVDGIRKRAGSQYRSATANQQDVAFVAEYHKQRGGKFSSPMVGHKNANLNERKSYTEAETRLGREILVGVCAAMGHDFESMTAAFVAAPNIADLTDNKLRFVIGVLAIYLRKRTPYTIFRGSLLASPSLEQAFTKSQKGSQVQPHTTIKVRFDDPAFQRGVEYADKTMNPTDEQMETIVVSSRLRSCDPSYRQYWELVRTYISQQGYDSKAGGYYDTLFEMLRRTPTRLEEDKEGGGSETSGGTYSPWVKEEFNVVVTSLISRGPKYSNGDITRDLMAAKVSPRPRSYIDVTNFLRRYLERICAEILKRGVALKSVWREKKMKEIDLKIVQLFVDGKGKDKSKKWNAQRKAFEAASAAAVRAANPGEMDLDG